MKESTRVLVALGAAIAGGVIIGASGSASLLGAADFIAPLGSLWVNAIRMTVIPLVVSLLITGIASATDVRAIGRIGARTLLVFVLLLIGMSAVTIPLASMIFTLLPRFIAVRPALPAGATEAASQIAAGGQTQTFATVAHVIDSLESSRRGSQRRDASADSVHAALRRGDRAQHAGGT